MTGPYGHKPECPSQDEAPNEVTFEGMHGTRSRATFTDDGRFARIRPHAHSPLRAQLIQ